MTTRQLQRLLAIALCVTVAAPGCASARWSNTGVPAASAPRTKQAIDPATLMDYLKTLPPGSTIRVDRIDGQSVRGTMLKVTDRSVTIQEKTRLPEPAFEIPFNQIIRVTPSGSNGNGVAKAIGIGAAAAAGAVLTIYLILLAAYAD